MSPELFRPVVHRKCSEQHVNGLFVPLQKITHYIEQYPIHKYVVRLIKINFGKNRTIITLNIIFRLLIYIIYLYIFRSVNAIHFSTLMFD